MPNLEPSIRAFLQGNQTSAAGNIALLGSRGAGMTALGEILADRGHQLIGFDQSVSAPPDAKRFHTGLPDAIQPHSVSPAAFISETTQKQGLVSTNHWEWNPTQTAHSVVCICSPAVSQDDRLRRRFIEAGIPTISLHEALDVVFSKCHQICIAGTHGKSTTTAMLAWIMEQSDRHPSYFIGAKFQHSGRSGKSRQQIPVQALNESRRQHSAIIESCEFNRSFHQLSPSTIVLTGLERDHFDCFSDKQAEDSAFLRLLQKLPADGSVIYNSNCPRSTKLVRQINNRSFSCKMQSHHEADLGEADLGEADLGEADLGDADSSDEQRCDEQHSDLELESRREADFQITNFEQRPFGIQFRIQFEAESVPAKLPVFGRHNATNAAHAIAAAVSQGLSVSDATHALASFPGIERRFQSRGSVQGMELIDDYAHHPTAVRTTLQAARKKFPKREIRVCFEPHQLIRLAQLHDDFVDALALADIVYVLPVLAARESASTARCHQDSHKLIIRLRSRGTSAFFSPNLDHVVRTLDHSANPNAVLLTMGAGSTHLIHDKLTNRLRRYSVA